MTQEKILQCSLFLFFFAMPQLTGILASSIIWDEVLLDVFTSEVSGIDCVLKTETQIYTYYIENGVARLKGEGDLHHAQWNDYRQQIQLTGAGLYSETSATYTLTLYPTDEFFEVYRTNNPAIAAFAAAMCIGMTSFFFIWYDFYVRKEFNAKKELLKAKRKFVNFVSHEVRTPLNSVCMGLTLMKEEIGVCLGVEFNDGPVHGAHKLDIEHAHEWLNLSQEIIVNAQSSVDVLNDLLNYDKIELGTLSLENTAIPVWNLIEMTACEFKLPAAVKQISLTLDYEQADPEAGYQVGSICEHLSQDVKDNKVIGDTVRISQVLRNLMSNALKFTKEGGKMMNDSDPR
jgi:signal transduction histidine kinase